MGCRLVGDFACWDAGGGYCSAAAGLCQIVGSAQIHRRRRSGTILTVNQYEAVVKCAAINPVRRVVQADYVGACALCGGADGDIIFRIPFRRFALYDVQEGAAALDQ